MRILVGEKNKRLVLLEGAAKGEAALRARVGLLDRIEIAGDRIDLTRKGVAGLKGLVAEVPEGVAVKFVGATLADDVDDTAAGAAVLRVVVAQNELKLLYALLREGRANGVDGVVDGIRAINTDRGSTAGARTADTQAAVRSGADGRGHVAGGLRICKREIDIAAAVDREIVDAALLDGLRDVGFGRFNGSGFRRHSHRLLNALKLQTRIK